MQGKDVWKQKSQIQAIAATRINQGVTAAAATGAVASTGLTIKVA